MPQRCSIQNEKALWLEGYRTVAGVDEAGRGCLFGPVYAAAVILDPIRPIRGLNDSKLLEPDVRERLASRIRERAICWAVASASAAEIDAINILQASRLAMLRAVAALKCPPAFLLIDAITVDIQIPQRGIIGGDGLCQSIAAASILAKTSRDARMREYDLRYPQFGFARHKGYGCPEHLRALEDHGPLPEHRYCYSPVRARLQGRLFA